MDLARKRAPFRFLHSTEAGTAELTSDDSLGRNVADLLRHVDPGPRRAALSALGRMEATAFAGDVAELLSDDDMSMADDQGEDPDRRERQKKKRRTRPGRREREEARAAAAQESAHRGATPKATPKSTTLPTAYARPGGAARGGSRG